MTRRRPPSVQIRKARSDEDVQAARELAWEFVAFLRTRYPEMDAEIDAYLEAQDFEGKLQRFNDHFHPPAGECLLAVHEGVPVGLVMLKPGDGAVCEMNRMYVRESARGLGIGRRLGEALIARARELGYAEMRLSALHRHREALPLYRSLGFAPCAPFEGGGEDDGRVVFLRRSLAAGPAV